MIKNPHDDYQEKHFSENKPQGQDFSLDKKRRKNNRTTRLIFGLFLFLGVGTLVFGFSSLYNNIHGPFQKYNASDTTEETQIEAWGKIVEMQNRDTDEDGLSDYDEEYIYGTSPYLADTDSDGFTDKQEIDNEHDPLCPMGVNCSGTDIQDQEEPEGDLIPQEPGVSDTDLAPEMVEELQKFTPAQVRELLIESGAMTEEDIVQINDEELMQMFNELLGG